MAETIAAVPGIRAITLGGSDVATEIRLPNNARRFTVYFETNPGKLALSGADAAAVVADYLPIEPGRYFEYQVDRDPRQSGKGPAPVYLAASIAGTVARIACEVD